jgi:hypothetical protein
MFRQESYAGRICFLTVLEIPLIIIAVFFYDMTGVDGEMHNGIGLQHKVCRFCAVDQSGGAQRLTGFAQAMRRAVFPRSRSWMIF